MKKKILLGFLVLVGLFTITGCETKENKNNNENNNIKEQQNINEKEKEDDSQDNSVIIDDEIIEFDDEDNSAIIDDEIIEFDDEDNRPIEEEIVNVNEVINCDNCVYAYFSETKSLGSTISEGEYTTDVRTLKTSDGKQRHNFFGLVLNGSTISRAYSCILKNNKIYCIEGSTNGTYHNNNIAVLNQIFTSNQCKTISNGNTYTCTDGNYNGDTHTSGYTSLHYETSCTIYGSDARTGELICH